MTGKNKPGEEFVGNSRILKDIMCSLEVEKEIILLITVLRLELTIAHLDLNKTTSDKKVLIIIPI